MFPLTSRLLQSCDARYLLGYQMRSLACILFLFASFTTSESFSQNPSSDFRPASEIAEELRQLGQYVAIHQKNDRQFVKVMIEAQSLESFKLLKMLRRIDELYVIKCRVGPQESELLADSPVSDLILFWSCQFRSGDVGLLDKLNDVKRIEFRDCAIDGQAFRGISTNSPVRSITLTDCDLVTGDRLVLSEGLKQFTHLRLTETQIDKTSFLAVMKQPSLGHAQFVNSGIKAEWLAEVELSKETVVLVVQPRLPESVRMAFKRKHPKALLQ